MKTILVGLILSVAAVANGQTSVLRGASPDQLVGVLGGLPMEAHYLPKKANMSLVEGILNRIDWKQVLKTREGDWYYEDITQPCHLTEVKFVFRDGRVESWTRFVPATTVGFNRGRVAPGSEPPPVLPEQELITRINASKARMAPFRTLFDWLACSIGYVTDAG